MTFSYWDEHPVLFAKSTWELIVAEAERRGVEPEALVERALIEYLELK